MHLNAGTWRFFTADGVHTLYHCAVITRSTKLLTRVAAFRRISREIVLGGLSSLRAMARIAVPLASSSAISSRLAIVRQRLEIAFADSERYAGGIPPELRNQRIPTGPETPASTAAFSLERPSSTARQNRQRYSRRQTGGRPGKCNLLLVDLSDFPLLVAITSS